MKPTRAGIGIALACALLLGVGRLLGLLELYFLGAMLGAALLAALVFVASMRLDLSITRKATPARLRAGSTARIDLSMHNRARRKTPVMSANDQLRGGRGASVLVGPIPHEGHTGVAYRLPAQRRGEVLVGPLELTVGDPLGLMTVTATAAEATRLIIHPQLFELPPITAAVGKDPVPKRQRIRSLATSGEEFFALRPYVIGDDLRRVNWRASSRSDDLVVRQEERPKSGRLVIVLDNRTECYTDESFDRATAAALSVLVAGFRGGEATRFYTTTHMAPTDVRSRADVDAVDEQLALLQTATHASLAGVLGELTRTRSGGSLIVVAGKIDKATDRALQEARLAFTKMATIVCERPDGLNAATISFLDGDDLRTVWNRHDQAAGAA